MPMVTPRTARRLGIGVAGVMACTVAVAGCAQLVQRTAAPAAPATSGPTAAARSAASGGGSGSSGFGEVPLAEGVSYWVSDAGIYFGVDREGEEVTTARAGMGNPRCFYGTVSDGVLQGRYRALTAGQGLDRQADPLRVTMADGRLVLTERATGTVHGDYLPVAADDAEGIAVVDQALQACDETRSAPATATPQ